MGQTSEYKRAGWAVEAGALRDLAHTTGSACAPGPSRGPKERSCLKVSPLLHPGCESPAPAQWGGGQWPPSSTPSQKRRESWEGKQQNPDQEPESLGLGAAMGADSKAETRCPPHVSPRPAFFIFHSVGSFISERLHTPEGHRLKRRQIIFLHTSLYRRWDGGPCSWEAGAVRSRSTPCSAKPPFF